MSGWVAFGFGFFFGAVIFDFAWRYLRRLEQRLRDRERLDYSALNYPAQATEAQRAATGNTDAVEDESAVPEGNAQ